jgi:hypothetical protein
MILKIVANICVGGSVHGSLFICIVLICVVVSMVMDPSGIWLYAQTASGSIASAQVWKAERLFCKFVVVDLGECVLEASYSLLLSLSLLAFSCSLVLLLSVTVCFARSGFR